MTQNTSQLIELLQIVLPVVGAAAASILSYYLGRKSRIDEIRITKQFKIAEEVASLFQEMEALDSELPSVSIIVRQLLPII